MLLLPCSLSCPFSVHGATGITEVGTSINQRETPMHGSPAAVAAVNSELCLERQAMPLSSAPWEKGGSDGQQVWGWLPLWQGKGGRGTVTQMVHLCNPLVG